MKGELFLRQAVGDQGYEALQNAVTRLPELESVVLPRVALAWLHVASELGHDGQIPGTEARMQKSEDGRWTIDWNGVPTSIQDDLATAAIVLLASAGCDDLDLPQQLRPDHVARLAKSVELMTKARFLKRVKEMESHSRSESSSSQTSSESTGSTKGVLEKGIDLPGKAAEPRGPQQPTAPQPQTKQAGMGQRPPPQPVGTDGPEKKPGT